MFILTYHEKAEKIELISHEQIIMLSFWTKLQQSIAIIHTLFHYKFDIFTNLHKV